MPTLEAVPRACVYRMEENAPRGAFCLMDTHKTCDSLVAIRRIEEVWNVSSVASFSSR